VIETLLTAMAVVLALTQPVPQVVRVLRVGSVAGVSGATTWLGFAINAGWLAYGAAQGLLPVLVLSLAYVVGYGTIGVLLLRHGNRSGVAGAAFAGMAGLVIVAGAGWTVLGTVLALAVGAQFLPQVVAAWRGHDLSGLAPGTYVVAAIDGLVWGSYGLVVADLPLVLYGVVMLSVAVLVLVPCARWSRQVARVANVTP
jgi:MtN3 and saliva related transmembrane protein